MKITTSYSVYIQADRRVLVQTVAVFRDVVDYLIAVCNAEWDVLSVIETTPLRLSAVERFVHRTAKRPVVKYDFDGHSYKLPNYLRRSAINMALGKVSSYRSNLASWESADPATRGKRPGFPKAGFVFPCMYRTNMYRRTGPYTAQIKVFVRSTWDWITVPLRKTDVDYITRYCADRKESAPVLRKRGKRWSLDFAYSEDRQLCDISDYSQTTIAAVDLGVNNAAAVSIMRYDGTILGRKFLRLPCETDRLAHAIGRIRKAQQHGARRMPGLWALANGINDDIAVKTAQFIVDTAVLYNCDVIVMEHLDLGGKVRGSKKQRLHLWKARYVQSMVGLKAHRLGMRVSRVNAWNTSRLAYDGSGKVMRGRESAKTAGNYSLCEFTSGKVYHCDLNASYNIGARYFVREITKSLPATARLALEAKVPSAARRSTCTLSALISLNAALAA